MARLRARTLIADAQVIRNDRVTIAITHEDWQSFARAVYPRADREFQRLAREYSLTGKWGSHMDFTDEQAEDGRCITLVHYERRFDNPDPSQREPARSAAAEYGRSVVDL